MQAPRATTTTVVTLLAAAGALAIASGAASCAASGAGENENFTDSGTVNDGTMGNDTGGDSQVTGEAGPACDADTMNNLDNCGSCGHKCGSGQTCSCGMCQNFCQNGLTACCGSCVDVTKDTNNCGQCGNQCLPASGGMIQGTPHCVASQCTFTCPTTGPEGGVVLTCGADAGTPGCYDPTNSPGACGGCGKICSGDCVDSKCCPSGSGNLCGGACTDLQNDPNNCGACDAGCGGGDAGKCVAGKCTGYAVSNPTEAFIDACSLPGHQVTQVSQPFWSYSTAASLPFAFTYFGTPQTQFWIGSQGTLGFGAINAFFTPSGPSDCTTNWPPPTFPPPDPGQQYAEILAFGDLNLATGVNGVCYGTTASDAGAGDGGAGNQFVVTWSQASEPSDPGSVLTFSVVLTEGTNTIDLMYDTASGVDGGLDNLVAGASATVGIQALQITDYTKYSCMTAFIPSTPFDIRFTPH